jgi:hypothetical protein
MPFNFDRHDSTSSCTGGISSGNVSIARKCRQELQRRCPVAEKLSGYEKPGRTFAYPSTLSGADVAYPSTLFKDDIAAVEAFPGRSIPGWRSPAQDRPHGGPVTIRSQNRDHSVTLCSPPDFKQVSRLLARC